MSQLIARIALEAKIDKAHMKNILEILRDILKEELREKNKVRIPGLLCATVRAVPEKPAKTKIVFGKVLDVPRKPATRAIRLMPSKKLRDL